MKENSPLVTLARTQQQILSSPAFRRYLELRSQDRDPRKVQYLIPLYIDRDREKEFLQFLKTLDSRPEKELSDLFAFMQKHHLTSMTEFTESWCFRDGSLHADPRMLTLPQNMISDPEKPDHDTPLKDEEKDLAEKDASSSPDVPSNDRELPETAVNPPAPAQPDMPSAPQASDADPDQEAQEPPPSDQQTDPDAVRSESENPASQPEPAAEPEKKQPEPESTAPGKAPDEAPKSVPEKAPSPFDAAERLKKLAGLRDLSKRDPAELQEERQENALGDKLAELEKSDQNADPFSEEFDGDQGPAKRENHPPADDTGTDAGEDPYSADGFGDLDSEDDGADADLDNENSEESDTEADQESNESEKSDQTSEDPDQSAAGAEHENKSDAGAENSDPGYLDMMIVQPKFLGLIQWLKFQLHKKSYYARVDSKLISLLTQDSRHNKALQKQQREVLRSAIARAKAEGSWEGPWQSASE